MKDYPEDVDINLGEIKHFHASVKQNYSYKGHVCTRTCNRSSSKIRFDWLSLVYCGYF
jgi:hypothetical protein